MKYSSYPQNIVINLVGLVRPLKPLLLLLLLCYFSNTFSAENSHQKESLENHFKSIIFNINQTLKKNQRLFQSKPKALADYVDKQIISIWSSSKTLSGFIGKKIWQGLEPNNRQDLIGSINNTLQRYSQEGIARYQGQQIEFVRLRLNKKNSRGFLTIRFIPNSLPSFKFDLKITNIENQWFLYDVMLEGISYISLKKDEYRKVIKEQGVSALIRLFQEKNRGYVPSGMGIQERGEKGKERGARSEIEEKERGAGSGERRDSKELRVQRREFGKQESKNKARGYDLLVLAPHSSLLFSLSPAARECC